MKNSKKMNTQSFTTIDKNTLKNIKGGVHKRGPGYPLRRPKPIRR